MIKFFKKNMCFHCMHALGFLFLFIGLGFAGQENPFRAERVISGHAKMSGEKINVNYTVYKKGDAIYTVNKTVDYDLPVPELAVFNNGQSVMVNSFDGTLTFFDAEGRVKRKIKILKGLDVKYERSVKVATDGDRLVLTLAEPGLEETLIQIYSSDGRAINQWKIEEEFVNGLSYSQKSGAVAVSAFSWRDDQLVKSVLFYTEHGKLISKILADFTAGAFIDDTSFFSGQTNKEYFLYDRTILKAIFTYKVTDGEMILAANYSDRHINLVTAKAPVLDGGKWFYGNPSIKQFNDSGKLLKSWTGNVPSFSTFGFKQDGSRLLFVMDAKAIPIK